MKVNLLILLVFLLSCQPAEKQSNTSEKKEEESSNALIDDKEPIILFFGNSITAGYGLELDEAFPALVQGMLDSLGIGYKVVNAGLSGETSSGGLNRIDWVLRTVPDIFVLELGANDGLRGVDLASTKANLAGIIEKVRVVNPEVEIIISGMEVPPNLGQDYTAQFREMFEKLSEEYRTHFIRFLLEGVAGEPSLNQGDGIHPTAKGHQIIAQLVFEEIRPLLTSKPTL